jgi:RNA polymerase sigma factor (sigma-70 family)
VVPHHGREIFGEAVNATGSGGVEGVMDHGGYDERFDELAGIAHRVAYRMVGSREDARDLTQEAMTRAFVHWRRASHHPEAWVSRVTANLGIDLLRRRGRLGPDAPAATADHGPLAVERIELVRALADLPRRQRQVVVMRYLADLPEAEVARELGCSAGSVKQHASRGLAALRAALAQPVPVPLPLEDR